MLQRPGERGRDLGDHRDALDRDAGVLQSQRQFCGPRSRAGGVTDARGEGLEVGVPDPRHVAAVGDLVVEDAEHVVRAVLRAEQPQHLVGAGRVLDQQDRQLASAERDALAAPEDRAVAARPAAIVAGAIAKRARQRGGGERVVDVVETGQRDPCGGGPQRRAQLEAGAAQAVEADVVGADGGLRAASAAARAGVDAEMGDVDVGVGVGGAAAAAALRVRRMGQARRAGDRGILDAEVQRVGVLAAEVGDQRVVGVQHERRRARRDQGGPALADRLELAVAVQLVAEQVAQRDRARRSAAVTESSQNSSTSNRPSSAPGRRSSSAEATPPAMFAPATLCTVAMPAASRIDAASAAVVVLPLVAETTTLPRGSVAASRVIAPASIRSISFPGRLVPPRPAARAARPTPRAIAARTSSACPPLVTTASSPARP